MTTETPDNNAISNEVRNSLKDDAQNSEKVDSGMDDDSQQSNDHDIHLSDEEENDVVIRRKSNQGKRILDDDDEEEEEEEVTMVEGETTPIDEKEEDSGAKSPLSTGKALNKAFDSGSENDSGSDREEESLSTILNRKKKRIANVFDDDSNESTKNKEQSDNKNPSLAEDKGPCLFGNSDLFDAEMDENSQGAGKAGSDNEDAAKSNKGDNSDSDSGGSSNSSRENSDDEGFDENSVDPKLLAKLKKGASKTATRSSKQKSRKDELISIHSETQRIVRESRVNLPYHQPEPKPLSDFLARASRKQELYRSLHKTRDLQKAKIMQETFEKEKLKKKSECDSVLKKQSASEKSSEKKEHGEASETDNILGETKTGDGDSNKSSENQDKPAQNDLQLEMDELPDLEEKETQVKNLLSESEESLEPMESQSSEPMEGLSQSLNKESEENFQESAIHTDSANSNTQCTDSTDSAQPQTKETDISESQSVSQHTKGTDHKLPFLLEPDLPQLSAIPKLSGGPDEVISLDDEEETGIPQHPGIQRLMGRFMDHCKKRTKHVNKDVDIKIVEKDKDELHMKTFTYHPTQEDENSLQALDAPGAKLMALKEKLQEKMKVKREESRKQRQDIYDLDNEELYEKEDEILDDDAEMSEHSDTDVEDDEFDEEFGEDEEMEEEEETEHIRNPFADDEAEEDDDGGEYEEEDGENLRLHLSDDENEDVKEKTEEEEDDRASLVQLKSSAKKKKPRVLQISDDEESRDVTDVVTSEKPAEEEPSICTAEATQADKTQDRGLFKEPDDDLFMPFSRNGTQAPPAQEVKRSSSLIPPVEDSQDLYRSTPTIPSSCLDTQNSQSLNFYIEESQSRMFDADGFLRTGSTAKKPKSKPYMGFDMDSSQDNYDELLGLCSGRFQDGENEKMKGTCKQQLFGTQSATQNNMEELMGLCSGKFAAESQVQTESSQRSSLKRKSPLDEEEEEDSNDSFKLVSDNEEDVGTKEKGVFSDEENEEDDEDDERSKGSEKFQEKFTGFTVSNKHGKIRKEFVEAEAELSGSEYDSDENLDLAEEEDILEMEEGDKDQVGTEEELRDQVGRAHLKQVIDEDKRELIRFQEMYLPDGDLHSEGQGRIRRFKWSNIDDSTQQDMFNNDSDEGELIEEDHEAKWRQERFEREKFLQEQEEKERNEDENSQFLKFGKVFLKRSNSEIGNVKKVSSEKVVNKENTSQMTSTAIFKPPMQKKGSFLGRNKESLAKIAELTKTSINPTGVRNSRNFVFQVISPDKDTNKQNSTAASVEGKVRKAHRPKPQQPAAKKPRLEKSASFPQNSIFNLM